MFFADQGIKGQLLTQIRSVRAWAEAYQLLGQTFVREYVETGGPFPERLNIIAITIQFLATYTDAVLRWAEWAEAEVEAWPNIKAPPNREVFLRILERSQPNDSGGAP